MSTAQTIFPSPVLVELNQIQDCDPSQLPNGKRSSPLSPILNNNISLLQRALPVFQKSLPEVLQELCKDQKGQFYFHSNKAPAMTQEQKDLSLAREDYKTIARKLAHGQDEYVDALIIEEKLRKGAEFHTTTPTLVLGFLGSLLGTAITFGPGTELVKDVAQARTARTTNLSEPKGFYYDTEKAAAKARIQAGLNPCSPEKKEKPPEIWKDWNNRLLKGALLAVGVAGTLFTWKAKARIDHEKELAELVKEEEESSPKEVDESFEGKTKHQLEIETEMMRRADDELASQTLQVYKKIVPLKLTQLEGESLNQVANEKLKIQAKRIVQKELAASSSWIVDVSALAGTLGIGTLIGFGAGAPLGKYLYEKRMTVWREGFQSRLQSIRERAIRDAISEAKLSCPKEAEQLELPFNRDYDPRQTQQKLLPGIPLKPPRAHVNDEDYSLIKWAVDFEDNLNKELSHRILFWGSKIDSVREEILRKELRNFREALVENDFSKGEKIKYRAEFLFSLYQGFTSQRDERDQHSAKWTGGLAAAAAACFALPLLLGGGAAAGGTGGGTATVTGGSVGGTLIRFGQVVGGSTVAAASFVAASFGLRIFSNTENF